MRPDQSTHKDWVRRAALTLRARSVANPTPRQILNVLKEWRATNRRGRQFTDPEVRRAKKAILDDNDGTWENVEAQQDREQLGDSANALIRSLADSGFASAQAIAAALGIGRTHAFLGNLATSLFERGFGPFRAEDIDPRCFSDPAFPAARPPFDKWYPQIEHAISAVNPDLATEMASFITTREANGPPLGARNLRTYLADYELEPEDHFGRIVDTGVFPLKLTFGPTDWWSIEAFNNRMMDESEFFQMSLERGWFRQALPPSSGEVPSYVTAHVIVTGPDYVVLTRRSKNARYFKGKWEISITENMQGPRELRRKGITDYEEGDASLHACALRGLREELGLQTDDIDDLLLLV